MIPAAAQRICHLLSDSLRPRVSTEQCIIYGTVTTLIVATCLCYKSTRVPAPKNLAPSSLTFQSTRATSKSSKSQRRHQNQRLPLDDSLPPSMPYPRRTRPFGKPLNLAQDPIQPLAEKSKQPCEAFLVLDVEATCQEGTDFNFPNEIIEFPVCLMQWKDRSEDGRASQLEVVEEFRSFVRPSWRPILSEFCTNLTGITQEQVDAAPLFPEVLQSFQKFLVKHGLIDELTGERLVRFCWCSDGPFDVRDFVVKQCFISKVKMPTWMQGDVVDVRTAVLDWLHAQEPLNHVAAARRTWTGPRRRTLNISAQLKVLGLAGFEGRQHSGIDDSRNVARVITELARRGISLYPNTSVHPNRRWQWMGKRGQILEAYWPSKETNPTVTPGALTLAN